MLSELMVAVEGRDAALKQSVIGNERSALLDIIRAIDSIGYLRAFAPHNRVSDLPGYLDVSWLGAARALSLFVPSGMMGPDARWSRSTSDLSLWASSTLYGAGLVTHFHRLADLVRYQLAELEVSKSGSLRFVITASDMESFDRQAIAWYARRLKTVDRPLIDQLEAERGRWVTEELQRRVKADPIFGISYSSSRELEEYFEAHAELRIRSLPGNDGLPHESQVGPFTYQQYRKAVTTGIARSLKHSAFADTLIARRQVATSRDILTIFAFDNELHDQWGAALNLNAFQSREMLEMVGLSPSDAPFLKATFDCPQALLIRGGDQCWHMPVYSGLHNPFPWMNASSSARSGGTGIEPSTPARRPFARTCVRYFLSRDSTWRKGLTSFVAIEVSSRTLMQLSSTAIAERWRSFN
ncbi:hypothetical protein GOL85_05565 [Sinorhizobium medicae]|nr:hypothetical protein [Sinorhizobium medicae]